MRVNVGTSVLFFFVRYQECNLFILATCNCCYTAWYENLVGIKFGTFVQNGVVFDFVNLKIGDFVLQPKLTSPLLCKHCC